MTNDTIHVAITTGVTNAASEGINRLIKTDTRSAFGYRNPANQRLRARCATTRRARGHLTQHTSGRHSQPRQRDEDLAISKEVRVGPQGCGPRCGRVP